MNARNKKGQKGNIIVFTLIILSIIISITLAVLGILLPKIKIASDPIKSTVALYSADGGIEWCLYVNRIDPVSPPPKPTFNNGAAVEIYYPSAGFTVASCDSSETPLDHRSVGTYLEVSRSLEVTE